MQATQELPIRDMAPLPPPRALKAALPMTEAAHRTVLTGRAAVQRILRREDRRLLVVVGPCSIHDPEAALEYAGRLNALRQELADRLCVVMRVYFEKPRTTIGWKGLIYDPHLDGSDDIRHRIAPGAPDLTRHQRHGTASRGRAARYHHPALPRGSHHLGGDWGPHQ